METELSHYLDDIQSKLRLDPSSEKEILYELYTHLEERKQELEEEGLSEEEAAREAAHSLGPTNAIAQEMNQVYSSGSWRQALLAASPHLLLALVFALRLWENSVWLLAPLGLTLGIAAYGWWHNKPTWLFPWLGYFLVALSAAGLFLLSLLGRGWTEAWWAWLLILVYVPLTLWLSLSITLQAVRRDWLLGSLTALPFPALAGWLLATQQGGFLENSRPHLYSLAPWITLTFLTLAGTVALFIRLRQRPLKTVTILGAGFLVLLLLVHSNSLGFLPLLCLILITLVLLLGPALLEKRIRHGEGEAWSCLQPGQSLINRPSHP